VQRRISLIFLEHNYKKININLVKIKGNGLYNAYNK